jgi:hypothetical protein
MLGMKLPESAVRRMKREYANAGSLCRLAKECGLPLRLTQAERFWRGDFGEVKGFESFLLMLGLRVKVEEV